MYRPYFSYIGMVETLTVGGNVYSAHITPLVMLHNVYKDEQSHDTITI